MTLPTARGSSEYGKIALANELPRRPGVYFFRDRRGEVFYVGKAKNLRTRVRSYFYGDTRKSVTNMLKELVSVDFAACATELEALVIELRLIHDHKPRYNRKSKPPKSSHWVKLTNEAFPRLALVRTLKEDGLMYLGPFRSRRAAETVMHAIWDALPIRRCIGRPGSRKAPVGSLNSAFRPALRRKRSCRNLRQPLSQTSFAASTKRPPCSSTRSANA